jgi:hypothetical protein
VIMAGFLSPANRRGQPPIVAERARIVEAHFSRRNSSA